MIERMAAPLPMQSEQKRRQGVRRTVMVVVIVIGAFYLLSFAQILLMK
jgi:hypothetical protein